MIIKLCEKYIYLKILLCIFYLFFTTQPISASKIPVEVKERHYLKKISDCSLPLKERIVFTNSLISLYKKSDSVSKVLFFELEKAKLYMDEGEYLNAFENYRYVFEQASLIIKDNPKKYQNSLHNSLLESLLQLGKCSRNLGLYEESTRYLFDLLNISKDPKDADYIVKAQSFLGGVFFEIGNQQMGRKYQTIALKTVLRGDSLDNDTRVSVYNNYAGMLYQEKEYDSALLYLLASHDYVLALRDVKREVYYLNNLALLYEVFDEDNLAKDCLFQVLKLTQRSNLTYSRVLALQGIARHYQRQKNYAESKNYYLQSIDLAQVSNMPKLKSISLNALSDLFHSQGNREEAYHLLKWSYALKDSVLNEQNTEKIMLHSNRYENNRIQSENEILQEDLLSSSLLNKKKNAALIIIIALIIFISFFTIYIIHRLRKQNNTNRKLNKTISTVHQESQQKLNENNQEFNDLLEEKNRKLASKALLLVQTLEQLNTLKEYIQKCKNLDSKEEKNALLSEMESSLNLMGLDQGWEEFRLYFEEINASFFEKLYAISPSLSKTEQRLCALLALNLTAKEIAALTNRSIRTIETFNYRIRKKLNILPDTKTSRFLCDLLG